MDDFVDDIEAGIGYLPSRTMTKKMKKRKQLNALLKFRSKTSVNQSIRSSEDELFLPNDNTHPAKRSTRYRRCCSYTRHILSFCLVCIFMIVCVGLAYANIELKNEVQNLSSRVTDIEQRFSNTEINRLLSAIEQIKTRLNLIERLNVSYIYERLQQMQSDLHQVRKRPSVDETSMISDSDDVASKLDTIEHKSTKFSQVANELDKLNRDTNTQTEDVINEKLKLFDRDLIERLLEQEQNSTLYQKTTGLVQNLMSLNESLYLNTLKWNNELQSLRSELQNFKTVNLKLHFEELTELVQNSTEKTSAVVSFLQTDLDKLRTQIEACKCAKETVRLKPSIVQTDQLQQSIITKPTTSENNATIDIAQVVNQQPAATPA